MKKHKLHLTTILVILFSLFNTNCRKTEISESYLKSTFSAPPPGYNTIQDYRNYLRNIYAEAIAISMKDVNFRSFIKHKILENPTTETEFLHAQYLNDQVNDSMNFIDFLVANSNQNDSFFRNTIPQFDPKLTVLIPDDYEPENWDTTLIIPLVVVPPTEWDDTISIQFNAYDSSGQTASINSSSQPTTLTIVIAETEILEVFTKPYTGQNGPSIFSNEWYDYFNLIDIYSFEGQNELIDLDVKTTYIDKRNCQRANSTKREIVYACKINGLSQMKIIEGWWRGSAELFFYAGYNQSLTNPSLLKVKKVLGQISRKQAKNKLWVSQNIDIIRWSSSTPMDKMIYEWIEADGGQPNSIPISLTVVVNNVTVTLNTTINTRERDDQAGNSEVDFCDDVDWGGTDYNTGIITFNVRH